MVPLVVKLTVEGEGAMVALVVALTGGMVRARAEGRVRRKVRACRLGFIVRVLIKVVRS